MRGLLAQSRRSGRVVASSRNAGGRTPSVYSAVGVTAAVSPSRPVARPPLGSGAAPVRPARRLGPLDRALPAPDSRSRSAAERGCKTPPSAPALAGRDDSLPAPLRLTPPLGVCGGPAPPARCSPDAPPGSECLGSPRPRRTPSSLRTRTGSHGRESPSALPQVALSVRSPEPPGPCRSRCPAAWWRPGSSSPGTGCSRPGCPPGRTTGYRSADTSDQYARPDRDARGAPAVSTPVGLPSPCRPANRAPARPPAPGGAGDRPPPRPPSAKPAVCSRSVGGAERSVAPPRPPQAWAGRRAAVREGGVRLRTAPRDPEPAAASGGRCVPAPRARPGARAAKARTVPAPARSTPAPRPVEWANTTARALPPGPLFELQALQRQLCHCGPQPRHFLLQPGLGGLGAATARLRTQRLQSAPASLFLPLVELRYRQLVPSAHLAHRLPRLPRLLQNPQLGLRGPTAVALPGYVRSAHGLLVLRSSDPRPLDRCRARPSH